jgi:recombination protein RecT
MSFAGALLTASALGLEPNTPNAEAYLVPYGAECTLIVGYQGLIKLFWQHPLAQHIDAQAVYVGDEFDYAYGLDPFLRHKPSLDPDRLTRDVTHYYAVASLKTGARAFVVLSPEQVKELRGGKVGPDKRFKGGDPMKWMERKTALRQLLKTLPRSTALNHALASDEVAGSTLRRRELAGGPDPQPPDDEPVEYHATRADAPPIQGETVPPGVDPVTGEVDPTLDPSWGQPPPADPDDPEPGF